MKETLVKIGIHLLVSDFLSGLECLPVQIVGIQAHPLDRFCDNSNFVYSSSSSEFN